MKVLTVLAVPPSLHIAPESADVGDVAAPIIPAAAFIELAVIGSEAVLVGVTPGQLTPISMNCGRGWHDGGGAYGETSV